MNNQVHPKLMTGAIRAALHLIADALADHLATRSADGTIDKNAGGEAAALRELLSVQEASALSGAGERRIRDAVNAGEAAGYRPGQELRIPRQEPLEWTHRSPARSNEEPSEAPVPPEFDPASVDLWRRCDDEAKRPSQLRGMASSASGQG